MSAATAPPVIRHATTHTEATNADVMLVTNFWMINTIAQVRKTATETQ